MQKSVAVALSAQQRDVAEIQTAFISVPDHRESSKLKNGQMFASTLMSKIISLHILVGWL
jgi:hypothetical protein